MSVVQARYLGGNAVSLDNCTTVGCIMVRIAVSHHRFASEVVAVCPDSGKNLTELHSQIPPSIVAVIIKPEVENELFCKDDFCLALYLHAEQEDIATCVRLLQMHQKSDLAIDSLTTKMLGDVACGDSEGHQHILRTLIRAGVDGTDALLHAASDEKGHHVVERLLSAGVCPDAADPLGNTALIIAARRGLKNVVEALLAAGANAEHANKWGFTALAIACGEGHKEVVHVLLSAGATADTANGVRDTELLIASYFGYRDHYL
eukprot:GEMP01051574.1.p1 GENE.GEMP01051574.1~~GEMP01051574.1.p1  ORF type:complete len:262 (+),score=71.17 GEMP01051574.1:179-964(+)